MLKARKYLLNLTRFTGLFDTKRNIILILNFRILDLWKILTAPCYFRYQELHGCKESLQAFRIRGDRA
jgi:hypothetical protein